MDPSEIIDEKSLKEWLETQPPDVAATIALRAAMRAAPLFWQFAVSYSAILEIPPIVSLRHLVHSQVAIRRDVPPLPPVDDREWTEKFTSVADSISASEDIAAPSSSYAAILGASRSRDAAATVGTCSNAADAEGLSEGYVNDRPNSVAARQNAWSNIRADCAAQLQTSSIEIGLSRPLWTVPRSNSSEWPGVRQIWQSSGPGWQFWIDWYEAALEGRPLLSDWDRHWNLLTEIALIPDADWTAGPDRVNALIAEIVDRHCEIDRVIRNTPNAEYIVVDEASGKLTSEPVSDIDGDLREHILRSVEKALERFQRACAPSGKSNFGPVLAEAVAQDLEYLREDLDEAAGYDLKLHDALEDCLGALRRSLRDRGFDDDPNIVRLMNILERCAIDVLNNSASAREVIEKRREEMYQRLRLEHQLEFDQLCTDMARDCLPLLQQWILADIALANNEDADPDQRRRSRYNLVSRLPRGARAIRYSRFEDGHRVVDADPPPKDDKLWVATVLGPIGAALLTGLVGV